MDTLRSYLKDTQQTQREFAETLGISQVYMSRIMRGHDNPGPHLRAHIELLTKGAVVSGEWSKQET